MSIGPRGVYYPLRIPRSKQAPPGPLVHPARCHPHNLAPYTPPGPWEMSKLGQKQPHERLLVCNYGVGFVQHHEVKEEQLLVSQHVPALGWQGVADVEHCRAQVGIDGETGFQLVPS